MRLPAALAGCAALLAGCTPSTPTATRGRAHDPSAPHLPGPAEESGPSVDAAVHSASAGAATTTTVTATVPTEPPTTLVLRTTTTLLPEHVGAEMSDVEWLVRQTFPEDPGRAARIAFAESRFDPHARNGQYRGVMQIGSVTHAALIASMGYAADDLYNPVVNLAVARRLFDAAGWSPWA